MANINRKNTSSRRQGVSHQLVREERSVLLELPDHSMVPLRFTLARGSRRSYTLVVNEHGELELRVPWRTPESEISRILRERSLWIVRNMRVMSEKDEIRKAEHPHISEEERARTIRESVRRMRPLLADRIRYYEPMLPEGHRPITKVSIRDQRTRWGSCSSKGSLSFNWKLYLAPPQCLDYVVVHELCHLVEMNHSPAFWSLVESIMPDYRTWKKWLKDNGHTLDV